MNIKKVNEYMLIKNLIVGCITEYNDARMVEVKLIKEMVHTCIAKYRMIMIKYSCDEIVLAPGSDHTSVLKDILN